MSQFDKDLDAFLAGLDYNGLNISEQHALEYSNYVGTAQEDAFLAGFNFWTQLRCIVLNGQYTYFLC